MDPAEMVLPDLLVYVERLRKENSKMRNAIEKVIEWRDKRWNDLGDRPSSPPTALLFLDSAIYTLDE